MPPTEPDTGEERLFLTSYSEESGRTAIVEEEAESVWFYLTEPAGARPVCDVWLFNKPEAPAAPDLAAYTGGPPPAPASSVGPGGRYAITENTRWRFDWTPDGEGVCLYLDGCALGYVTAKQERGMARHLLEDGPWGLTWDDLAVVRALDGLE